MTTTDGFSEHFTINDKAEVDVANEEELILPKVIPHRVFINHVDSFYGKHIASFLADQVCGALKIVGGGGEEGAEEEELQKPPKVIGDLGEKYEIIGTLQIPLHKKSEDILYTINEGDENFIKEILKCGFVIYNICGDKNEISKALNTLSQMADEIEKLKEVGPKTFKGYSDLRIFILLSTVMTWGATKPIDPEDPTTPFSEIDYKKRKPHPNYKEHINCEKEVVLKGRKYKDKLRTYVICSGIVYGEEEEDFNYYFRKAWNNEEFLPIFENGKNFIPLIHIKDLTRVIHNILEMVPSRPQYILAVEQTPCNLKQIVKSLSVAMGRGKVQSISKTEAFLDESLSQTLFERYTVNLHMEPGFIVDELELEWKNELNLAENMGNIITEFRKARNLKPLRLLLHGPPAVGKSRLAKKLCALYGVEHITVKSMIDNILIDLKDKSERAKANLKEKEAEENANQEGTNGNDDADEEVEDEEADLTELVEQIQDIETTMTSSVNNKLPDDYVIKLMKKYLMSNRCQNQGYVLDGYPKTMQQAMDLFGTRGEADAVEEEEEEEEDQSGATPVKIMPDFVITLQAPDDFLCNRIMILPEEEIQGTHYAEEPMLRRLMEFRNNNTDDNTMLNFFDEIEIHPIVFDAQAYYDPNMEDILKEAYEKLDPPVGFGPTLAEEIQMHQCEEEEKRLKTEAAKLEQELLEQKALEDYQSKMEEWTKSLEKLHKEEEKLIIAQSEPLRNYLMKYVFPTLTKGLIDVASNKPRDPVDYLAEYLFRENPEGHMFDPSYTRAGELLAEEQKVLEIE
ncbi:hypothetical protein Trydic_g1126 [Trypoxylus dichotomus]